MDNRWKYNKFSNDIFMLSLNLPRAVRAFEDEPLAQAMWTATRRIIEVDPMIIRTYVYDEEGNKVVDEDGNPELVEVDRGSPKGPMNKPSAWKGNFTLDDGTEFRISAVYGMKNIRGKSFLGLVADTKAGNHDSNVVKEFLDEVNASVKTE